ncbi:MAG: 50S ribosomal protein L19e [Nanoarchaeota archaeon]
MNLSKKKELAKRTLGIGKDRIIFVESRLEDIKEAITKQDIRDLMKDGAIVIREIGGRKKIRKKSNRGPGNIRKGRRVVKRGYIIMTRKLRKHVAELKKSGEMTNETFRDIRKKIRNKVFRSKAHLREHLGEIKK